ncbi:MAG: exonuclease domain-containing protein [Clostridiales bacterium]|nr:exonuclease domain-containing protein [Clostridiales bacterium]
MQYIVLDLEWNQPLSYNSAAYKSVGGKLLFEMIQIGAVKVDEQLKIVDSFSQLIRPTHYVKLHPRIARITHIDPEDLADAPDFNEAVAAFAKWCGEDYVLLTWGCDDISVLNQNMTFFKSETSLSKIYDIQRLFGEVIGNSKERKGLKAAMEHYEIQPDDNMPFHNAVNDAYYTALVFAHLPDPTKVLDYPLAPRKLQHLDKAKKECTAILRVRSLKDALKSSAAMKPPCPVCGKHMEVPEGYVRQREDLYMALGDCPQHGLAFVKMQFGKNDEGKRIVTRSASLSDEQSPAYVHTKHLQWAQKMAMQQEKK